MGKGIEMGELYVRVPLGALGCITLWLVSLGLLTWGSIDGPRIVPLAWGLYSSAGAASATVLIGNRREHRRVIDVMEGRFRRAIHEDDVEILDVHR